MIEIYTPDEALKLLRKETEEIGRTEAAKRIGLTVNHLGEILRGQRGLGPKVSKWLGLRQVHGYAIRGKE